MATERLKIRTLPSFIELTAADQALCLESYRAEQLDDKNLENKYMKRTAQLRKRASPDSIDNECFLCFDVYPMNFKYSTILFCLCGITHHAFHVLYVNVIEDTRLESLSQFVCDLLANMITTEMPKLKEFSLKFILCRNNPLNNTVLNQFAESTTTSKLFNTFPFILDTNVFRQSHPHDPYVQLAWIEIMLGNIQQNTVGEIFQKHREAARIKNNAELKQFVDDFCGLARDLLDSRFSVNLRLCTMDRMDYFEHIISAHMKAHKETNLSRSFLFDLIRALIHIYGH
ncbi:uncharacterized protein LOC6556514 [Drosophila grimshawi]|uniref:GH16503 n=1 Tax=Drosophila grimshawi TaxID=7222 RepID=B4J100_DROGR|nr:uncharacterized protein LOC6556514 [Drosophila grimshawi]EDV96855.1 GH16503 [Drosophila grimshawi]